jgi:membrane-associated phospholipid phosphatase
MAAADQTLPLKVAVALMLPVLFACSDGSTDPAKLSSPNSSALRSGATPLASISWQARGRTLTISHNQSPLVTARTLALLGVAQYGAAVDASDEFDNNGRSGYEATRGAVAGASAQVLSFIFPDAAAGLEQQVVDEGHAAGSTHPHFVRGVAVGRAWGNRMIAWAKADGFTTPWTGSIPVGDGFWRSAPNVPPAGPQFGAMRPYFMSSPSEFHPLPPPAFNSDAYKAGLNEVATISANRTAQQLAIAVFWNLPQGTTSTASGYWGALAAEYITEEGLSEREAAHVFALAHATMLDAVIGCWEAKYSYFFIRPSQANPAITLPIGLPNHPSYPSGHSCVSSSGAAVIASFFPQHTATMDAQVEEAGLSRIYGGIHYRFDIEAGRTLGLNVARKALQYDQSTGLLNAVR